MRSFDVTTLSNGTTQLWTAMKTSGYSVNAQVANSGFGNIVFTTNHILGNTPITSDSPSSIKLTESPGKVTATPFRDFEMSMVVYPEQADLWIVKLVNGTNELGVKINPNWTISLVWTVGEEVITKQIVFLKQVSYLAFSVFGGVISLQLNDQQVTIEEGDSFDYSEIEFGGGESGKILVDKIALSIDESLPKASSYFGLFRSQRLDTVARPFGSAAFTYLNDISTPSVRVLKKKDFSLFEGFYYFTLANPLEATMKVENKTGFFTQYSLNLGTDWFELPAEMVLPPTTEHVMFRHNMTTDLDYSLEIKFSTEPVIALPYAETTIDGYAAFEKYVGIGYYDVALNDLSNASITLTGDEPIKTLEMLVVADYGWFGDLVGVGAFYINGKVQNIVPGQLQHMVFVYTTPVASITLNSTKEQPFKIAGIGVSTEEYSRADAFYIYNTFAGNVYTSAVQEIGGLTDGVAQNSLDGSPSSVIQVEWNS